MGLYENERRCIDLMNAVPKEMSDYAKEFIDGTRSKAAIAASAERESSAVRSVLRREHTGVPVGRSVR